MAARMTGRIVANTTRTSIKHGNHRWDHDSSEINGHEKNSHASNSQDNSPV